ncbi:COG3014 family protein [Vibrio sp. YIC-376]|uniref:COG3014 family protein n=1 Tax=Vibrio sp. YIC-376 TaxID=3136162 RepID=UPI00402AF151
MKLGVKLLGLVSWALMASGCANLSAGKLFSHYSDQNQEVYQAVASGEYAKAKQIQSSDVGGEILGNFEKGRLSFLAQDYPASLRALENSDRAVRTQQDRAIISVSETATNVGSLAVNDNLQDYQPADYELGFLHLYLALNYLQKNDLEGALVEVRRANQVQEAARKAREKELEAAEKDLKNQGMSANLGSVLARYPDAGEKLSAVQNGYLFYLSGLLYEASRDLNSAYVDYRRALAVMPDNPQVIESTMYVAKNLGMREDLRLLEKRYGNAPSGLNKAPSGLNKAQGRVIVLDEQGVVEALNGWRIDLPIYDSRNRWAIYSLALPYYPNRGTQKFGDVSLNGTKLNSSTLADVNAMAQNDLNERLMSIVIRQALRVWAKDRIRKEAAKKGDDVGNLLFNVWNTLTEQPDTRSWQTLPAQVKTASQIVKPGTQSLNLGDQVYQFDVPAQQTTLVWVSRQGAHSTVWHKQLGRL